jgi:hypothetical protein
MAKVQRTGNWRKAEYLLGGGFAREIEGRFSDEVRMELAEEYVKRIKHAIDSGKFKSLWAPIKKEWSDKKGHQRPWFNHGDLYDALAVDKVGGKVVFAGIRPSKTNRRGQQLDLIAMILEMGSHSHSQRPLFEPVAKALSKDKGFLEQVHKKWLEQALNRA